MQKQFTAKRMVGLGLLTAATIGWMWWMVVNRPPVDPASDAPPAPFDWGPFTAAAIGSLLLVIIVDVIFVAWTLRRSKTLTAEEKQPFGPQDKANQARAEGLAQGPVERTVARQVAKGAAR